jgi:hypothetical protein
MKKDLTVAAAVAPTIAGLLMSAALANDGLGVPHVTWYEAAVPRAPYARLLGSFARHTTLAAVEASSDHCGDDSLDVAGIPRDDIQQVVDPTDQQRAALDELSNASTQAAQIVTASCPTNASPTPIGRIDAIQQRVQAMLQAVQVMRPPLEKLYNMLSDEQKARLNALTQKAPASAGGATVAGCTNRVIPDWPNAQILRDVRPTPAQRTLLDAVQAAAAKARGMLEAPCPTEMPVTPPARLSAIEQRLQTIAVAIQTVRGPVNDFYGSLTDEQKARLNSIGRTRATKRG